MPQHLSLQRYLHTHIFLEFCWTEFSNVLCKLWKLQPDTLTGDIVFVLQLKEHPKFKRKFDDLYVEHTLSLTEALCGFQFALTHLDGRQLLIKSNPGEVIKPGMYSYTWIFHQPCIIISLAYGSSAL